MLINCKSNDLNHLDYPLQYSERVLQTSRVQPNKDLQTRGRVKSLKYLDHVSTVTSLIPKINLYISGREEIPS